MVHFNGPLGLLLAHEVRSSALGAQRVLDLHVARQIHERLVRVVPFLGVLRAVRLDDVGGEAARLEQVNDPLTKAEMVPLEHAVQLHALLDRVFLVVLLDRDIASAYSYHYSPIRVLLHLFDLCAEQVRVLINLHYWHKSGQDRHQRLQFHLLALLDPEPLMTTLTINLVELL